MRSTKTAYSASRKRRLAAVASLNAQICSACCARRLTSSLQTRSSFRKSSVNRNEYQRRRIDLLGIDEQANLVVIELKRTEDGGHMDLQAIRYAAMVSTLTFDQAANEFGKVSRSPRQGRPESARDDPGFPWVGRTRRGVRFRQDVRIVLASAEFSKELTSSVLSARQPRYRYSLRST